MKKEKTKAKEKEGKEAQVMRIVGLQKRHLIVPVVSVPGSSLICNRFTEQQKKKIEDKQQQESSAVAGRVKRNPEEEYKASLYVMEDGRYGIKSAAFKRAIVNAAGFTGKQISKTLLRGALHIMGDYIPIKGTPSMRTDVVRLKGFNKPADMRYRGEFKEWEAELDILYNEAIISQQQIVQMLHLAGFSVGVGDWRPECNGTHGMFDVKQPK